MNTPSIATVTTVRSLLTTATRKGRDTEWSAYRLACLRGIGYAQWDTAAVRVPETSLVELVRADQRAADNAGYHAPAVTLMREGIRDGLSCPAPGQGNRARRRIGALNMCARRKCRIDLRKYAPSPTADFDQI